MIDRWSGERRLGDFWLEGDPEPGDLLPISGLGYTTVTVRRFDPDPSAEEVRGVVVAEANVLVRTSSATVEVPVSNARELAAWLHTTEGGAESAAVLRQAGKYGVRLSDEQKRIVLRELDARVALPSGPGLLDHSLLEPRAELRRDLEDQA
ncbi:MAG TPA: hypothetical protein VKA01_01900 [Vicinamibacteria bacterium]|nr:hypothetical protein [Vicinamibacteria bacterium]